MRVSQAAFGVAGARERRAVGSRAVQSGNLTSASSELPPRVNRTQ